MQGMDNTGSTSTVVSITDRLHNITEELDILRRELGDCIDASSEQDFMPDPDDPVVWHPISLNRDTRWDSMDVAYTKIVDTIAHLSTAHSLSVQVDKE